LTQPEVSGTASDRAGQSADAVSAIAIHGGA